MRQDAHERHRAVVLDAVSSRVVTTEDLRAAVDYLGFSVVRELGLTPEQWHQIEVRLGRASSLPI